MRTARSGGTHALGRASSAKRRVIAIAAHPPTASCNFLRGTAAFGSVEVRLGVSRFLVGCPSRPFPRFLAALPLHRPYRSPCGHPIRGAVSACVARAHETEVNQIHLQRVGALIVAPPSGMSDILRNVEPMAQVAEVPERTGSES